MEVYEVLDDIIQEIENNKKEEISWKSY